MIQLALASICKQGAIVSKVFNEFLLLIMIWFESNLDLIMS